MHRVRMWGLALVLGAGLAQTGMAQQPIVIKFSHVVAADTPKGRAAELFRMRAEDLTKGRVRVEVYHNAQFLKDSEEFAALQDGRVHILAPSVSKFGPVGLKEFEVFDVPYLFSNQRVVLKVLDGPVGRELFSKLESRGMRGLAYWDNGFKVMSANTPLSAPSDMRGLKVRIQDSKVIDAQMRALGALPEVMTLAETYARLKSGALDGTENPPSNLYSQRIHEVQKYVVDTRHGYLGYAVITNRQFWDGLPPDIRTQLEQALRDATRYANSIAQQQNEDALAVVERSRRTSVTRLSEAQRKAWQQALLPVRKAAEARVGAEFMKRVENEVQAAGDGR